MERLVGKRRAVLGAGEWACLQRGYDTMLLDLGTGDGRYVDAMARQHPHLLVVGLDACRETLVEWSRRAPANALYLIANALSLPDALDSMASWVTLNFPWGSLLAALLERDTRLLDSLARVARPGAVTDVRINGAAAAECGVTLEEAVGLTRGALAEAGFRVGRTHTLGAAELRAIPSTWAHRLAFGRDPRAIALTGRRVAEGGPPRA